MGPSMVRKGSPVRVRQRAFAKPLETAAFLVPGGADAASVRARGPHLGRIRSKYPAGRTGAPADDAAALAIDTPPRAGRQNRRKHAKLAVLRHGRISSTSWAWSSAMPS